jgi:hypothetical protein
VAPLEGRTLLSAALPHHLEGARVAAHVVEPKHYQQGESKGRGPTITVINHATAGSYRFTNFDGPSPSPGAVVETDVWAISNSGTVLGSTEPFGAGFGGPLVFFSASPLKSRAARTLKALNGNGSGPIRFKMSGINSASTIVGADGTGKAFYQSHGKVTTFTIPGATSTAANGINDQGTIVGNYTPSGTTSTGFITVNAKTIIRINAPSGEDYVVPTAINNKGLVVGYYLDAGTRFHGFMANEKQAHNGTLTATAIKDPVPEEAGVKFYSSSITGVNDKGIAVGYYIDSTQSIHGFILNLQTGKYTFLEDPSAPFLGGIYGVQQTEIYGITNSGEILGEYDGDSGIPHGFVATPIRH